MAKYIGLSGVSASTLRRACASILLLPSGWSARPSPWASWARPWTLEGIKGARRGIHRMLSPWKDPKSRWDTPLVCPRKFTDGFDNHFCLQIYREVLEGDREKLSRICQSGRFGTCVISGEDVIPIPGATTLPVCLASRSYHT